MWWKTKKKKTFTLSDAGTEINKVKEVLTKLLEFHKKQATTSLAPEKIKEAFILMSDRVNDLQTKLDIIYTRTDEVHQKMQAQSELIFTTFDVLAHKARELDELNRQILCAKPNQKLPTKRKSKTTKLPSEKSTK